MIRYRCMRCRKWHRFSKPIGEYIRKRTCRFCGSTRFYRIRKRKQITCWCSRYWFPHRYTMDCGL